MDWVDPAMQHPTNRRTAEMLKEKIKRYDKFVFIASDAALASKWCNWEIGFGDAHKYEQDKIAIFPIKQDDRQWGGNEYLQLYPSINILTGRRNTTLVKLFLRDTMYITTMRIG